MRRHTDSRWAVPLLAGLAVLVAGGCAAEPAAAPPASTAAPVSPSAGALPPSSTPEPTPMARSRPVRVQIPAIDVDSRTMRLGLQPNGTMQVPPGPFPAGWYRGSPTPGELGPAVIVGHVNWNERAGVFADLARLTSGDEVVVRRSDGRAAVFRVTRTRRFSKDAFPTAKIYGDLDHAGLRLITCGGHDRLTGRYDDNVVVFARLAGTS